MDYRAGGATRGTTSSSYPTSQEAEGWLRCCLYAMTLTIHKLSTHCRSPKGIAGAGALVDDVGRGPLAFELSAQLGPSLERLPAVVRVRQLRIELAIPAGRLNASVLTDQWARAFALALHRALAYPEGDGTFCIRRYQSQAEYNAALLQYLLTEGTLPTWQFPE